MAIAVGFPGSVTGWLSRAGGILLEIRQEIDPLIV